MSLVSVITATAARHDVLLNRCIPSVENQVYAEIEHIVVSDGPDPYLESLVRRGGHRRVSNVVELGRNQMMYQDHWGAIPRLVGAYLARGQYIAYLDDDNEYLPFHIESLMFALQRDNADVAFSQMQRHFNGEPIDVIGDSEVDVGHIDTSIVLHRADLLWTVANWQAEGYCSDGILFKKWKDAGVKFTFVPEVTVNWYK